jgi:hypothetical protein
MPYKNKEKQKQYQRQWGKKRTSELHVLKKHLGIPIDKRRIKKKVPDEA